MDIEKLLQHTEDTVSLATNRGADQAEVAAEWGTGGSVNFEKNDLNVASSDEDTLLDAISSAFAFSSSGSCERPRSNPHRRRGETGNSFSNFVYSL